MEYDEDDLLPKEEWNDHLWWCLNRWAEEVARYLATLGINYADYCKRR